MFLISTEVEKVAINFNKPDVQWLDKLTVEDANKYLAEDRSHSQSQGANHVSPF